MEVPHHASWSTVGQSRGVQLGDEFLKHSGRFLQSNGFSSISLVGLQVDVIKRHLDEFSRALSKARKGFWSLTISEKGVNLVRWRAEAFHLLKHVSNPSQHRDGPVKVFEQVLEVHHHVIDRFAELLLQALLDRPASETAYGSCCLRHLPLKQRHDLRGEQMAGRRSDMVDGTLNHLKRTFHRTVEHGHGVAQATCVFQPLEHRTKALEGVVVVQQGLSQGLFSQACTQPFCFLNIGESLFMGFGE